MAEELQTGYAFWKHPDGALTVTYSLPSFHEIDFQVQEGFRRIPHGGVETGGLLFGRLDGNGATILAFRPIECEHASGPSFVLSERDLRQLGAQLAAAESDAELKGMDPIGWFIAHTRSPMVLNEREAGLFEELFPGPGRVTLIVKPERFQPTRFGFVVRGADGRPDPDAGAGAVILPLPGRTGRAVNGPVASIPASREKVPEPASVRVPEWAAAEPVTERLADPVVKAPETRTVMIQPPEPEPIAVPDLPAINEIRRRRRSEYLRIEDGDTAADERQKITKEIRRPNAWYSLRLALVLLIAAVAGCSVGYVAYLQLPPATVELRIKPEPGRILVSWPAEQTRNVSYAALRIDDGPLMLLSTEEKLSGAARLSTSGDNIKIELIAQHWMRDSRGIVRYIQPVSATSR